MSKIVIFGAGGRAGRHAVYGAGTDPGTFFPSAARALVKGLRQAGVDRLVTVGLSTLLPGPDGTRALDAPGFPAQFRPFCLARARVRAVYRVPVM